MRHRFTRLLSLVLAVIMVLAILPVSAGAAIIQSGTCGEGGDSNLAWRLDDSGTLTIGGTGAMISDILQNSIPWYSNMASITSVVIQNGVTSIGGSAFYGCSNLTNVTIPDSVTSIGWAAFRECSSLTNITIPDSVTDMGASMFRGCSSLTNVVLPENLTNVPGSIFYNCTSLTNVTIPDSVESIGFAAFDFCSSLTEVEIPDGVVRIEDDTFEGCTSLTEMTIPDSVTSIGRQAFANCSSLTSVTIPDSVNSIGAYAFVNCRGLTEVKIPDGVTTIEQYTFGGCTGLTSVTIPGSVSAIEDNAFTNCKNTTFIFEGDAPNFTSNAFANAQNITVRYPYGNDTWTDEVKGRFPNSTFQVYGRTEFTISPEVVALNTHNAVITITSSVVPFDTAQAGLITVSPGTTDFLLTSTEVSGNSFVLTLHSENGAQLGTVSINIPAAAMAVELFDDGNVPIGESIVTLAVRGGAVTDADGDGYDDITGECLHVQFPEMYRAARPAYCTVGSCTHPASCACGGPAAVSASEPSVPTRKPKKDTDTDTKTAVEESVVIEVDDTVETHDPEEIVISGTGEPALKDINKPGEYVDWIDRVRLPNYALTLYRVLEIGGDNDQLYDLLIKDEYNTLSGGTGTAKSSAIVESVVTMVSDMDTPYSGGGEIFQSSNFLGGFDTIDTTDGDRQVEYSSLKEGDVVRTSTFNGIYVTKVKKDGNNNYDNEIKEACAYASTSFQAFDRDHPEIFWLSGKSKLRMITAKAGGVKETYLFFVLVDHERFTVRDPRYPNQSSIETELARVETAIDTILQTVTGATVNEQIRQLNRWLTEHNEYNTSADLQHLPNWPHECVSALVGSIGTDGPVCDGYSRAFKVLCGRLNIPCVLVDGYARASAESKGEFHMWNSVQLPDGKWYGVDVTWNDPVVKGVSGAKSGHENENFLLTGGDTVTLGLKFSESHPPVNRAANGGVSFINGPTLSAAAYDPHSPVAGLPFTDVASGDWFAGEVQAVYEKGIMTGVSADRFAPNAEVSRAMVLSVLYRLEGEPSAEPVSFDDVEAGQWYTAPISWAAGAGIAEAAEGRRFAPDASLDREGLALWLWRAAGSPAPKSTLDAFADRASVSADAGQAFRWAVGEGIIVGSDNRLEPKGSVTRAQAAAMLVRYLESAA